MATIHIPDDLDRSLQHLAEQRGQTKDEVAQELLESYLEEASADPIELSDRQIDRMRHSIAQADAGEVVSMEETQAFFESWTAELKNRQFSAQEGMPAELKTT
jgi:predicted transcriptional regulator